MTALRTDPRDTTGHAEAAAYRAEHEQIARDAFAKLARYVDSLPSGTDTPFGLYETLQDGVSDYLPRYDEEFEASDGTMHCINISHRRIAKAVWDELHPLPNRIRDFRGIASEIMGGP